MSVVSKLERINRVAAIQAEKAARRDADPYAAVARRLRSTAPPNPWRAAGRKWAMERSTVDSLRAVAGIEVYDNDTGESLGMEIVARQTPGAALFELWQLTEGVTGRKSSTPSLEEATSYLAGVQAVWNRVKDRI